MVMVLTETRHSGGFVVSESAELYRSRDQGTFVNSGTVDLVVQAGLVLASGAETDAVVTAGTNTGNGTLTALTFGASAATGTYLLKMTGATTFTLRAPNGVSLPGGSTGAYSDPQLGFTLTAGGTAFVSGDTFTIAVPPADTSFVPWVNAAPAVAIMYNTDIVAAGTTARVTVLSRAAEVNGAELVYDPSIVASVSPTFASLQATAALQLKGVGIIVR